MNKKTANRKPQTGRKKTARFELIPFEIVEGEGRVVRFVTPKTARRLKIKKYAGQTVRAVIVSGRFVGRSLKITALGVAEVAEFCWPYIKKGAVWSLVIFGWAAVGIFAAFISLFKSDGDSYYTPSKNKRRRFTDWDTDDGGGSGDYSQGKINIINNSGTVNVQQNFNNH